jgi:ABC-type glycerol-3-phosphate transport system substrate-binding protein
MKLAHKFTGLILVAAISGLIAWQLTHRPVRQADDGTEVIRIAHIFLETRDAIDTLGRAYEEQCRQRGEKVKVVQIAVPHRLYASWFITQLIGNDTPELLAIHAGSTDDRLARYIEPLTSELTKPNPYNKGTDLAGVPWLNTFPSGMRNSYNDTLLEYYSVPLTHTTTRLMINLQLYREIFGDSPWPGTYEGFVRLCQETRDYAAQHGRDIFPIASSSFHASPLFRLLARTQTERLTMQLNATRTLRYSNTEQIIAWLNGGFSLQSPEVQDQLTMINEIAGLMQPGYTQLGREDADMYFTQGRALMLINFSNSDESVRQQIDFPLGVVRAPAPLPTTPRYGHNVLGPSEDKSYTSNFEMGLAINGRNRARALDFLKFATSKQGNRIFAQNSRWTPSVAGVEPHPNLLPYLADPEGGYQLGFDLSCYEPRVAGNIAQFEFSNQYLLADQRPGAVKRYVEKIGSGYDQAMRSDAARDIKSRLDTVQRNETIIAFLDRLAAGASPEAETARTKRDILWEANLEHEAIARFVRKTLVAHPAVAP